MLKLQRCGRVLLAMLCVTTLTACETIRTTGTPSDVAGGPLCVTDGPISFSAMADSQETIAAVRRHNAAWRVVCK